MRSAAGTHGGPSSFRNTSERNTAVTSNQCCRAGKLSFQFLSVSLHSQTWAKQKLAHRPMELQLLRLEVQYSHNHILP